jgi:hypothetical protein
LAGAVAAAGAVTVVVFPGVTITVGGVVVVVVTVVVSICGGAATVEVTVDVEPAFLRAAAPAAFLTASFVVFVVELLDEPPLDTSTTTTTTTIAATTPPMIRFRRPLSLPEGAAGFSPLLISLLWSGGRSTLGENTADALIPIV